MAVRSLLALLALGGQTLAQGAAPTPTEPATTTTGVPAGAPLGVLAIDQADLQRHAFRLASDAFGGRYSGSAGYLDAVDYVVDRFRDLGLEPLGDADGAGETTFLQTWPTRRTRLVPEATGLTCADVTIERFGVLPGTTRTTVDVDGPLVWIGSGARDEIPDADLAGSVPIVALRTRKARLGRIEAQFMTGLFALRKAQVVAKRLEARGARTTVFCLLDDTSGVGELLNYAGLLPGKPLLEFAGDTGMASMADAVRSRSPQVFLGAQASATLFAKLGVTVEDGRVVRAATDAAPEPVTAHVRLKIATDDAFGVPNVVACLRGSDPALRHEALVVSAHLDHMGTRLDGDVFNGADDNASGSSGLLEVAEAFVRGEAPRRSVVFLAVGGEELGLWGSQHYAANPTWPLENIVANVNIDMIGRATELSGPDEISITPSYRHEKYSSIARRAATIAGELGLGLTIGDQFYTRSDHYNFAVRGVPVVFFCDGEHEDYHQVTDHPDKLDYAKMERITRLAYWTAFTVTNPIGDAVGRPQEIGRQRRWLPEPPARDGAGATSTGR